MNENMETIDTSIIDSETVQLQDGLESLAKILGGIAITAMEHKKMLQSKDPTVLEGALKTAGVLGAGLVGIGASIAKFCARNIDNK